MERMERMNNKASYYIEDLFRQLILSWLIAVTLEVILLPAQLRDLTNLEGLSQMSIGRLVVVIVAIMILLFGLSRIWNTALLERMLYPVVFACLSFLFIENSYSTEYAAICLVLLMGLIIYALYGWKRDEIKASSWNKSTLQAKKSRYFWLMAGISVFVFFVLSAWTVARVRCFATPTFDFGIFAQMFYNMKESGLPMTTVERDGLLSHFHVHMSPIYYLMLPFYWLFPNPMTLQVLQAMVMVSAVIPLWKIGRRHGLSEKQCLFAGMILLLYPAFGGGAGYDIHENCFLTPLILWVFYGLDAQNGFLAVGAAILTLMVKEDAAVYVAVIGLWYVVRTLLEGSNNRKETYGNQSANRTTNANRTIGANITANANRTIGANIIKKANIITGVGLLVLAVIWFFCVTGYLAEIGDGVMTYRYNNFIYDGSGSLMTVIKSVILNPMKAVFECVDVEKHKYIIMTLFPILGVPLLTRRYERYILFIPYILVNLMSDYPYQHEIFFQYSFGSVAFAMYLLVVNLADWKKDEWRSAALIAMTFLCAAFFSVIILPRTENYVRRAVIYDQHYDNMRSVLSTVREDASVTASTFYTTELSQREILYDVRYSSAEHLLETEYVVIDPRSTGDYVNYADAGQKNGYENLVRMLEQHDYKRVEMIEGILEIYQKNALE